MFYIWNWNNMLFKNNTNEKDYMSSSLIDLTFIMMFLLYEDKKLVIDVLLISY